MSVVIDPTNGAQLLPPINDERATFTAWTAHLAADGDLRTKRGVIAQVAANLTVYPDCECDVDYRCLNHDTAAEAAQYAPRGFGVAR